MAGVKFEKLPLPGAQDLTPFEVEQIRTALNNLVVHVINFRGL